MTPQKRQYARTKIQNLSDERIDDVVDRLADDKSVRRTLPEWGRLHIDRRLPFLCVYRKPPGDLDELTGRLLVAEASYLLASADERYHRRIVDLVTRISELMVEQFGAFLIIEIWADDSIKVPHEKAPPKPAFAVHQMPRDEHSSTLSLLVSRLRRITTAKQPAEVSLQTVRKVVPPNGRPLFSSKKLQELGCHMIGIAVDPIYINPKTGEAFPLLLRSLKRQFGRALDQVFYEFSLEYTTHQPAHYYALGRRAMVKDVWEIDRRLAAVGNSFDLLFQVTPINAERAWRDFQKQHFEKAPAFLYRPRVVDPGLLKRSLYDIHIERVEDPTLMHLFLDKQMELDRQLTMLHDLGTKQFMYESLQLHGPVSDSLLRTARRILSRTPAKSRSDSKGGLLTASAFARRAKAEIEWYRERFPEFSATALVSSDLYSGLMVSRGRLLIGKQAQIPSDRANALIQHEVGTHLLTYYNGQAQPFKMLYAGMPGYDELQEGLAVLAEYLVGGLTASRLRVLAARVVAAHALMQGATFIDVFRMLKSDYRFTGRAAYTITMRIFRGGGLLKDAIYLRGLVSILKHLSKNGDFDILFTGKFAVAHIPVIEELLHRKILKAPPIFPRYLEEDGAQQRMKRLREGVSVLDLLKKHKEME